ncbi:MAG: hypothetical protein ACU843_12640 [Gammaproteobacteria bacterium]
MTETLEYNTDILRSRAREQRIALRPGARRSFEMEHILNALEYSSAQEMVRRYEEWYVADWTQRTRVTVTFGANKSIPIEDAACFDFGEFAVLWSDEDQYEVIEVAQADSNGIVAAEVLGSWSNVFLMPAWLAFNENGLDATRATKDVARIRTSFHLAEQNPIPESTYSQYRTHDVMTDCPLIVGGLEETLQWPTDRPGSSIGKITILRDRAYPDATFTLKWLLKTQCAQQTMRRWLDSRYGAQRCFWVSSRGGDFELASAIGPADTTIEIVSLIGTLPLARTDFDIEIVLVGWATYRRQVTGWALNTEGNLLVDIDSALGISVSPSQIVRISNLRLVRFAQDRFELSHHAGVGANLAANIIEVPFPETGT